MPRWAAAAGLIPVSAGIGLILQPAPENLLAAVLCSVIVAVLIEVSGRSRLALTLLPVVAAFTVGCAIFLAADADLLDGPLRTLLAPLAVLLPGALIVTGMSELAAGAMVAGTSRLVFGTVQLLLFSAGLARRGAGRRRPRERAGQRARGGDRRLGRVGGAGAARHRRLPEPQRAQRRRCPTSSPCWR